jgi:hypothetical protein
VCQNQSEVSLGSHSAAVPVHARIDCRRLRCWARVMPPWPPQLESLPHFGTLWRSILDLLASAAAANKAQVRRRRAVPMNAAVEG